MEEKTALGIEERREIELVRAAQLGDEETLRELLGHFQRPVYRLAYALTRSHQEASDLSVECLLRAVAELPRLPEGKRFAPGLLRLLRNLSVAHARRRAAAAPPGSPSGGAEPEQRVLDALSELGPDEQIALALRIVERLPYADIAALLDHSAGATLARLSTARGFLLTRSRDGGGDLP